MNWRSFNHVNHHCTLSGICLYSIYNIFCSLAFHQLLRKFRISEKLWTKQNKKRQAQNKHPIFSCRYETSPLEIHPLKSWSVCILNLPSANITELYKHAASAHAEASETLMGSGYNSICIILLCGIHIYWRSWFYFKLKSTIFSLTSLENPYVFLLEIIKPQDNTLLRKFKSFDKTYN